MESPESTRPQGTSPGPLPDDRPAGERPSSPTSTLRRSWVIYAPGTRVPLDLTAGLDVLTGFSAGISLSLLLLDHRIEALASVLISVTIATLNARNFKRLNA